MMPPERPSFAALLRQILVQEKHLKLKDVAEAVELNSRNFYGRVTGRIQFSPDEINRVIRAVPDPRLGDWLFHQTPLFCALRPSPADTETNTEASALDHAMNGAEQAMAALRAVLHVSDAAGITPEGIADAQAHAADAQRQLGLLMATLQQWETKVSDVAPNAPAGRKPGDQMRGAA